MKRYAILGLLAVFGICWEPSVIRLRDERFLAETVDVFERTWRIRFGELEEMRMKIVYKLRESQ